MSKLREKNLKIMIVSSDFYQKKARALLDELE